MRRFAFALAFGLIACGPAAAAELEGFDAQAAAWAKGLDLTSGGNWAYVASTPRFGGAIVYIDRGSLQRAGGLVTARFRSEFRQPAPITSKDNKPDPGRSVADTRRIDCARKAEQLQEATFFRQNNLREPYGKDASAKEWSTPPEQSVARIMLDAACGKASG